MNKKVETHKSNGNPGSILYLIPVWMLLTLIACASSPVTPTAELLAAEHAINTAEQARIASPELSEARKKLTAARAAVEQEKMVIALRLAEQSHIDAKLAFANAQTSKAKAVNDEMEKSTNMLEQEMQRNIGEQE